MLSFVIVVMVRRVCDFFVFYVFCSVGFYVFCSVGFSFICFDSEYVEFCDGERGGEGVGHCGL